VFGHKNKGKGENVKEEELVNRDISVSGKACYFVIAFSLNILIYTLNAKRYLLIYSFTQHASPLFGH
jgi:hypothetical protein